MTLLQSAIGVMAVRRDRRPRARRRLRARAGLLEAPTDPKRIDLDRFLDAWNEPDTQNALQALVARLKK
ncbi:MAG TPA: hypothetical protein VGT79_04790 [Xanthomonadaceae bacterium]|nr:hypothetical protein [Xanthomonadaceae bacterium]